MLPAIDVACEERSETGHKTVGCVRKSYGLVIPAILPVCRQFFEKDAHVGKIEYPEAPLSGRLCIVDDREDIRSNLRAARLQSFQRRQRDFQGLRGESRSELQESAELGI